MQARKTNLLIKTCRQVIFHFNCIPINGLDIDLYIAGAPTLSKLLELPPRDRNQPLPQINSLMTTTTESTESGDIFLNKTAINQDSPTKLLAALGQ